MQGPRDTSTAKQTLPGDIKPTAWKARKEQAHEAGVIGAWPAVVSRRVLAIAARKRRETRDERD